jgi:hypothetical protein
MVSYDEPFNQYVDLGSLSTYIQSY